MEKQKILNVDIKQMNNKEGVKDIQYLQNSLL